MLFSGVTKRSGGLDYRVHKGNQLIFKPSNIVGGESFVVDGIYIINFIMSNYL